MRMSAVAKNNIFMKDDPESMVSLSFVTKVLTLNYNDVGGFSDWTTSLFR